MLAGCGTAYQSPTPAYVSGIPVGPGPQSSYSVQAQPAPGTCHYTAIDAAAGDYLPDPKCTPGAVSPVVDQKTLQATICMPGYTATIRPPESVTGPEKTASEAAYGFTGDMHTTEYDHLVSLELGGDPNDPRNLWPEPNRTGAMSFSNPKDAVENELHKLVCNAVSGKPYLPLTDAQNLIATDWTTALAKAPQYMVTP